MILRVPVKFTSWYIARQTITSLLLQEGMLRFIPHAGLISSSLPDLVVAQRARWKTAVPVQMMLYELDIVNLRPSGIFL